jgi:LuxR family maltose regulon positive regulatory protein
MAEEPSGQVLVTTKLHPPVHRAGVLRPDLVSTLRKRAKLVIVSAAAGSGKTTLLAQWHATDAPETRFAWFALDEGDNDPIRFWTYVLEALSRVDEHVGTTSRSALLTPGLSLVGDVLPRLINELAEVSERLVLVLDDYHLVRAEEIHQSVAFLVDHLPDPVQIVIATRTAPPLPVARLRAHGDLVEIGLSDLRFTTAEAQALLLPVTGDALTSEDVDRLTQRTEGWAAGLYMAGLSLQHREDPRRFIDRFSGDDRNIVDFLGAEVLDAQPAPIRDFMLRTAVLDRLEPRLCRAVTSVPDTGEVLAGIERSNLFLVPLDTSGQWYRYHHLFADLLRLQLTREHPEIVTDLHRRAAQWLLEEGFVPEAVHHTIRSGDWAVAGDLVARHWNRLVQVGQDATVMGWLDALPHQVICADARLCLAAAITSLSMHRLTEAEQWLATAEQAPALGPFFDGFSSVLSGVAVGRAILAQNLGDIPGTNDAALQVIAHEPTSSPWRAVAETLRGICLRWSRQPEEAEAQLVRGVDLARATRLQLMAVVYGLAHLSALHAYARRWDRAEACATEALDVGAEHGIVEHYVCGLAHVVLGMCAAATGDLQRAESALLRGVDLAGRGAEPLDAAYGCLALALVRHQAGQHEASAEALHEARRLMASCRAPADLLPRLVSGTESVVGSPAMPRTPRARRRRTAEPLSDRELSVLRLLSSELTQSQIADRLFVSVNTVKTHTRNIFRKLDVSNRAEAVKRSRDVGVL